MAAVVEIHRVLLCNFPHQTGGYDLAPNVVASFIVGTLNIIRSTVSIRPVYEQASDAQPPEKLLALEYRVPASVQLFLARLPAVQSILPALVRS